MYILLQLEARTKNSEGYYFRFSYHLALTCQSRDGVKLKAPNLEEDESAATSRRSTDHPITQTIKCAQQP